MWGLWDEKLLRLDQRSLNYAKLYYYYPSGTFRIQFTQPIEYSNTFLQYYFGLGNLRQGLCTLLVWTQFLEWKFVNSLKVKIFLITFLPALLNPETLKWLYFDMLKKCISKYLERFGKGKPTVVEFILYKIWFSLSLNRP